MERNIYKIEKRLYITNEENIKEWCDKLDSLRAEKIILTNDPKLIADGVQELTEEQLKEIVSRYPLDYVEVKKGFADGTAYGYNFLDYSLFFNSFSAENIESSRTEDSKILREFELINGCKLEDFDAKDWIKFDRFVERREKENKEDFNNKDNWEFERSSGYAGYRNEMTGDWIYEKDYLEIFAEKDKTAEKETLEKIKFVLSANNEEQAIRFIEQYGEWVKENYRKEFENK